MRRMLLPTLLAILFFTLPNVVGIAERPLSSTQEDEINEPLAYAVCNMDSTSLIVENALSPQIVPKSYGCLKVDGSCIVSEEISTEVDISGWNFAIYQNYKIRSSTDITTYIECSGSFAFDVIHLGGPALRFAETGMIDSPQATIADNTSFVLPEFSQNEVCNYLGPALSCKTSHTGTWVSTKRVAGEIVAFSGQITVCGSYRAYNMDAAEFLVHTESNLLTVPGSTNLACDGIPAPQI